MKTTLLAVCGLSPQVLTETVFGLSQQNKMPDRIRVLTTRSGREACIGQLFDGGQGAWYQLLDNLKIKPETIDFSAERVQAVLSEGAIPIDDISDEADNEAFVQACLKLAWQESQDDHHAVYYSIAGGRKTMGAALGFAAQAYGRPQDRIFHVLVSPEFESTRSFFFPPETPQDIVLYDTKGQPYRKSTRYAELRLVSLPFFSFRDRLGGDLLEQPRDPATLLGGLVREEPALLLINLSDRKLIWKGREADMRPAHLALYALLAELRKSAVCTDGCPGCELCWLTQGALLSRQEELSRFYRQIDPRKTPEEMSDSGIFNLTPENFQSYRSKLNRGIEKAFGIIDFPLLQIGTQGNRPNTRYGIALQGDQIRLIY